MLLTLKASSVSMHSYADLPDEKGIGRGRQVVSFQVQLDGHDHVNLETGEVFQKPSRWNKEKLISAVLTVEIAKTDEYYAYNRMSYSEELVSDDPIACHPSEIYISVFVPSADLQELVANIRSGFLPSTITVELPFDLSKSSPIQYGWEPDGSGKKWLNRDENNRHVKIQGVSFHYDLLQPVEDSSADDLPAEPKGSFDVERANAAAMHQMGAAITSLRTEIKTMGWAALIFAFAIAYYIKH
ncbi:MULTISPECIES: hypothetical protein [Bradyrhizobium]|uniref:hypothetical protein n=1 Tax=Bradyrhizobium TaxID=374 RepID=UPI00155E66D7|nr:MULTISPECIES: hypothetical protein [Bradyrhizobium]MDD1519986.1 hypothetical protein [Bradyrhizobium sp. WBAH30]MDD1544230.1 hypothetical protein [Bradyrhizobium sp. WBAH41]MDD1558112.1 hypothetical protein [Bradyrhizobium sp. WBAH23]MDD1565510.1 hypothetical protein [Bradyrhizobium sp. WBAH33]MDD1590640.1 hypothetical protein [Bradyrhizobium sp. WBAH42]